MTYDFNSVTVLVIDDNQPMLDLTRGILTTFGVGTVITARNGEEGYAMCCRHNPDFILTDWMMDPMDGIEMTRKIRNSNRVPNKFIPVILMTGFSEKFRVIQARDQGITEFLVKPFKARDLYTRLVQIIEKPRQFVRTEDFFGPDRRRKTDDNYIGPRRRASDRPNNTQGNNARNTQKRDDFLVDVTER